MHVVMVGVAGLVVGGALGYAFRGKEVAALRALGAELQAKFDAAVKKL
jgi:hypothetical protein